MGKSTISMVIFNSYVTNYQRAVISFVPSGTWRLGDFFVMAQFTTRFSDLSAPSDTDKIRKDLGPTFPSGSPSFLSYGTMGSSCGTSQDWHSLGQNDIDVAPDLRI